jgi:hypothetical protein
MHHRLPPVAIALGLAGLVPLLGCGIAAASAADAANAQHWLFALVAYGALILAFLGGVHWGLVLAEAMPPHTEWRLALGVVPSLVGWVALLTLSLGLADVGLGVLIAGFIAAVIAEAQGYRRGLVPPGYMWLRWMLTIAVLLTLVTVLGLRLLGARLIF